MTTQHTTRSAGVSMPVLAAADALIHGMHLRRPVGYLLAPLVLAATSAIGLGVEVLVQAVTR